MHTCTLYTVYLLEQQISLRNCVCRVQNDNTTVAKRKPEKKNGKSCIYNCDDLLSYNSSPRNSHNDFHYIHNSHRLILSWVDNEPIQRHTPSWLVSSTGKSTEPVSQRSRVQIPYKPEFFSGFLFATAKVAFYNCDDLLSYTSSPHSSHI